MVVLLTDTNLNNTKSCSLVNICQSGLRTTGWSDIQFCGPKMLGRKRE